MAECAQCMYENAEGVLVCEQCGAELAGEVLSLMLGAVCRSCDSYNDPGVRMCVSCGTPIGASSAAETDDASTEADEPAQPGQWMAPPDSSPSLPRIPAPAVSAPLVPPPAFAPATLASPAPAPKPVVTGSPAPLPPGALPPGWSAFQQKGTPVVAKAAPVGSAKCSNCGAENTASARFCGSCGTPVASAGAPRARGKLIVVRGISGEGKQFPLTASETPVGREGLEIAFPEDPYVAPRHALFQFKGDALHVKDEGSANGIFVKLRGPQALAPGDLFVVGERLLRWVGPIAVHPQPGPRHGSPLASSKLFQIDELYEGGGVGRICRRPGPVIAIGRAGCDLNFPQDGFVSARHAEISLAGDTAFLRDLGSANGTYLRIQPRQDRALSHGDYLLLGREVLRVELSAAR